MRDKYDATASLTGYLYQCRYALLAGLEASKTKPALVVTIERFDDIAFESEEDVAQAIQTKHHGTAGELSDASVDLWKTLAIWIDRTVANPQLPFETQLVIVTTATAPEASAAELLRGDRAQTDVRKACDILVETASKSKNSATQAARTSFLGLSDEVRLSLLSAIVVYDNAPSIIDVRDEIEALVAFSAPAHQVGTLVDYLEGWWFAQVIEMLAGTSSGGTSVTAIRSKVDELREHFKIDQLPLTEGAAEATTEQQMAAGERMFVQQIRAVGIGEQSIKTAIRDYYRASAQRSRWARESLLLDGETTRYDAELKDRWSREFEANRENIDSTSESQKLDCGRKNFHWANRSQISFRNRSEMWLTAGSFQMLADDLHIGWHPDYDKLFGRGH
jgi:hypothetical protein